MKSLIASITVLFFASLALAETPPVVLEDGKELYEIGLNLNLLEDPTGKLTIEDVNRAEWARKFKRSDKKVPNFGFSKSAFWFRVKIKNLSKKRWYLNYNYNLIDEITFFKKNRDTWEVTATGDTFKNTSKDIKSSNFVFSLLSDSVQSTYFFRLKSQGSIQAPLSITSKEEFYKREKKRTLLDGLYYGSIAIISIYNLFIFFGGGGTAYLYYVVYMISMLLVTAANTGFGLNIIYPNFPWLNNSGLGFFVYIAMLFQALFTVAFLNIKKSNPIFFRVMRIFQGLCCLLVVSSFFVSNYYLARINAIVVLIGMILSLSIGLKSLIEGKKTARFFLAAFLIWILSGIAKVLSIRGALPSNNLINNAFIIGHVIEAGLLSLGLAHIIATLKKEAKEKAKELFDLNMSLESRVEEKTKSIKDLVENLGQGFMVLDKNGIIQEGATQITRDFFNIDPVGKSLPEVLNLDGEKREVFNKWLQNIWRGTLTFRDLRQLGPQSFKGADGRYIDLDYKAIYMEESKRKIDKVICVATDKTQEIALERQLELDKQNAEFITTCLQNPVEFVDLLGDTFNLLESYPTIRGGGTRDLFRKFHTLKARYGQFGARDLTYYINEIETGISNDWAEEVDSKVSRFDNELQIFVKDNRLIIEAAKKFMVDNGYAVQVSEVMEKIKACESLEELEFDLYKNYLLSDIKEKFERYRPLVDELAETQSKVIDMDFTGDKVLVEYAKFSDFVNVSIHLFRNMVDHGIETEDERIEKTKPQRGSIKVEFKNNGDSFYINMTDDGEGIDPERIKDKVLEKGLKSEDELQDLKDSDFVDMIFLPGFSTKEEVTDVSGRGVGMDAVRASVERLGGTISVSSKIDEGTTFVIKLPNPMRHFC